MIHVVGGVAALGTGAGVLALPKGTALHRALGRTYVAAMAVPLASSFGIYQLRGGPSAFHAVTIVASALVAAGWILARRMRRAPDPDTLRWHLRLMQMSYLVLVVTFVAQFFDRLPLPSPALNAIDFLQLPAITGFVLIVRSERRHLAGRGG